MQLYSTGVLIMDKCAELLPDYFSFVKGLVDSEDLSLNISRETLQHDGQLKLIAKTLEKKIKSELEKMLKDEREAYEEFFKAFGIQLKFGIYNDYGAHKETLRDLLIFRSTNEKKYVTLKEYVSRMKEGQDSIYYACGETDEKIDMLPQTDAILDRAVNLSVGVVDGGLGAGFGVNILSSEEEILSTAARVRELAAEAVREAAHA